MRAFFAPEVVDALAMVDATLSPDAETPLVALSWLPGSSPTAAINRIVSALAGVAAAHWPDWYDACAPFDHTEVGPAAAKRGDDRTIDQLGARNPALNRAWTRAAVRRCRRGAIPVLDTFPPAVQVQQLMLALAQPDLIVLLAMESAPPTPADLLCFARTAAWVAGETGARVAAFVPMSCRDAPELDAIAYGAVYLEDIADAAASVPGQNDDAPGAAVRTQSRPAVVNVGGVGLPRPESPRSAPRRANDEPLRLVIPPIIGRPHPSSPGEQLLAAWLARDRDLATLFEFNQRVNTTSGESFVVDLLWREGKMAVEVDGYGWHSSPVAFAADRHRDYRLLCDGYRTLRLPHDEVMDDPALQCEKIRDVVRMIQKER